MVIANGTNLIKTDSFVARISTFSHTSSLHDESVLNTVQLVVLRRYRENELLKTATIEGRLTSSSLLLYCLS